MVNMTDDETKEYDKSVNKLYKDTGINIDNLTDPIELSRYITKLLEDYYNSDAAKIISILNEEDRKRAAKILFYVFCGDYNLANYKHLAFKKDQKRINSDTREIHGRNK